jgi:hypothetical protein
LCHNDALHSEGQSIAVGQKIITTVQFHAPPTMRRRKFALKGGALHPHIPITTHREDACIFNLRVFRKIIVLMDATWKTSLPLVNWCYNPLG